MSLTIICVVASGVDSLKLLPRGVRRVLCHAAPRSKTLENNIQFGITCKFQTARLLQVVCGHGLSHSGTLLPDSP